MDEILGLNGNESNKSEQPVAGLKIETSELTGATTFMREKQAHSDESLGCAEVQHCAAHGHRKTSPDKRCFVQNQIQRTG